MSEEHRIGAEKSFSEEHRIGDLDIWVVPDFAQTELGINPASLQQQLEQNYPVRGKGDSIEWAQPQWIEGENEALHYRGKELKRGKMWFQLGEPKIDGFVKYYYTGWQKAVLPATSNLARAPELVPVVERYNALAAELGWAAANHFIVTHYASGEHNIGMHFDKPKSIRPRSLITIIKTGAHGRPFRLELLDGTLLMERVLPPGTAVIMTLEANLATRHGVPAVDHAGSSGSLVLRTIDEHVSWARLEQEVAKFYAGKKRKAAEVAKSNSKKASKPRRGGA